MSRRERDFTQLSSPTHYDERLTHHEKLDEHQNPTSCNAGCPGANYRRVKKKEGDQASGFTLENIDVDEVALSVILEVNEVLLVDSWASWCGPSIAKVPELKELHTAYKDRVFEIVCVSFNDRKQGLEDNEVPGVHNADLRRP